ncbi:MAG: AAA family ATPase, partial [Acidimicrobiia bacterium]|nr:AAA family ATPase [Acidimicrobiia bacterium]
ATMAREDDGERAVRAGLELVDMVAALGEELDQPELRLRAGVNSGSTSVGPGGNEKGLVVGDLVNTASRLQSIAEPGSVFVGATTHSVTSRSIDYETMGERSVKGKSDTVLAWKAIRVAAMVGGRTDGDLRQPPFVGRDREMRLLKDQLAAVETEQRARLVSIVGEGGIGKTRLAEEFKNHIDGFSDDVYWHQGRSPSYGDGVTFWALGEMIRRRAGIVENEDPARARTRLRTCAAEFIPSDEDRRWIEPRLEGLLGLGEMPAGSRAELFSALRSFFQHIAGRGTTVLVFEDLHWADSGLVDFIAELVERSARSAMLVITLARPDLLDRHPTWGAQHRSSMAVRLAPLTNPDMEKMLTEYLPGVDGDVIGKLVERSAGMPLYAVEMVRMLTSSGRLVQADEGFRYEGDLVSMALPDSLQAVIAARLDRLDPGERSLLQDGAVLGQTFTPEGLVALREGRTEGLDADLRRLVQLELLDLEDDPRSPERGQYRFVQSLIREVAYQRLNRPDRRSRHLAAARYFEGFGDPELAGVVAGHFMGAFDASPDGAERDELAARALRGLADAAARAAELGSHAQAMGLLDQAIELSRHEEQKAGFRLQAAGFAEARAEVERGIAYINAARKHFEQAGDIEGVRRAATAHSSLLNSHYRSDEALTVVEPVFRKVRVIDDPVTVRLAAEAARSYALTNNPASAIEAVVRLLPAASSLGLTEVSLDSLVTQATALGWRGRVVESRVLFRGVAAVAEEKGLLRVAGRAINNLAATLYLDDPQEATRLGERLHELANRLGDFSWMVRSAGDTAGSYMTQGRYEEALARLDEFEEDQLSDFWKAWWDATRAAIELRTGGGSEAFERTLAALTFYDDETDPQLRAGIDQVKCQAYKCVGRWDDAYDLGMQIDHLNTGAGIYEAAQAAAWTRRVDRVEAVAAFAAENTNQGLLIDGLGMYLKATRAA